MTLRQLAVAQFGKPQGALGHLAGLIMATRPSNRSRNAWTVDLLRLRPGDRVLEIGCGPGLAIALAAAQATKGKIIGIDHSPVMIRQAEMRNRQAIEEGRVELIVGGLDRLERMVDRFDKIYSVNVVQFLANRAAFFTQASAMLKPASVLATTYMPRS